MRRHGWLAPLAVLAGWVIPPAASAELGDLDITTLEHAAQLEKTRGLPLEQRVETVVWPRTKVRAAVREAPDPLDPRPVLAADLPLYQRLGLLPWGSDAEEALAQVTWPVVPGAVLPIQGQPLVTGRIVLVREAPRPALVHRMVVGLALLAHHHPLPLVADDRDRAIAATALRLGDAFYAGLSSSIPMQPGDLAERTAWARGQLEEVLTEPSPTGQRGFLDRLVRAMALDGLSGVVGARASTPWGGVDSLYRRGQPRSTAQLLHPAKLVEDSAVRRVDVAPIAALAGRGDAAVGRLGELRTRLWLEQWIEPAVAARAAEGWSGDAYALFPAAAERPESSTLVLLFAFDTAGEAAEEEARDFAGALDAAVARRFQGELQPLGGQPADASAWIDPGGLALLVERRDDKVLYFEGCQQELLGTVRDQVWDGWRVALPPLGVLAVPDAGPAPVIAQMAPAPWYRRTPGVVALALWLLVLLPLASYGGSRVSLSPVKIYLYGLLATAVVIGLGWLLGL
jgi:hypothetical protein